MYRTISLLHRPEKLFNNFTTEWEPEYNVVSMEELSLQRRNTRTLTEALDQEKKNVEAMEKQLHEVSLQNATLQRLKSDADIKLNQVNINGGWFELSVNSLTNS